MPAVPHTVKRSRNRAASLGTALPLDSICQEFSQAGTCKYGYRCKKLHIIDGILNGDVRIHPSAMQPERPPPSPQHSARASPVHASHSLNATHSNQAHWPLPKPSHSSMQSKDHSPEVKSSHHHHKSHRSSKPRPRSKSTCDGHVNHNAWHENSTSNQDEEDATLPPVPPPDNVPSNGSIVHRWLSHQVEAFVHRVDTAMHTIRDKQRRATAALNRVVRDLFPDTRVEVYGSTFTQLCLPHSDVDCVLVSSTGAAVPVPVDMLELVQDSLAACAWAGHVDLLRSARIPILKLHFVKGRHPVKMDVTCGHSPGHSGMDARTLVDQYRVAMPALRPLVLVLKAHLLARGLNASYSGGLSSYALVLMVVRFLQFQGDVHTAFMEEREPQDDDVADMQPCMIYTFFRTGLVVWQGTIGMLLMQFLDLHVQFDFGRYGLSIANGGEYFEIDAAAANVLFPAPSPAVYIMDPLRYNHVIGNSFRFHEIVHAWQVWLEQITQRVSLRDTLAQ